MAYFANSTILYKHMRVLDLFHLAALNTCVLLSYVCSMNITLCHTCLMSYIFLYYILGFVSTLMVLSNSYLKAISMSEFSSRNCNAQVKIFVLNDGSSRRCGPLNM